MKKVFYISFFKRSPWLFITLLIALIVQIAIVIGLTIKEYKKGK